MEQSEDTLPPPLAPEETARLSPPPLATLDPEEREKAAAPGWFGKLQCLGDFASRRLPESFVAQCDSWLSRGVASSRQQLGERWLDVYLTAPFWRFALAPGVADSNWWLGALMPSVDRVGRYFPLLLCESFARAPCNRGELDAAEHWFDHLSAAALATLLPDASIESFEASLQAAPAWQSAGAGAANALPAFSGAPGHDRYRASQALPLAGWIAGIGAVQLQASLHGRSLWWAPPAEGGGAAAFSIAEGWPPAQRFGDLLEGRW